MSEGDALGCAVSSNTVEISVPKDWLKQNEVGEETWMKDAEVDEGICSNAMANANDDCRHLVSKVIDESQQIA